jgi:hypothetical protein
MPQSKKVKTASNFTPPLIELEDLRIYFGSDISKVENQTLELYSLDGLTYYGDKTQADNEKRIGLMWYNKNEEGFKGFADGIYDVEYDEAYDEESYLNIKREKAAQDIEFKKENAPKTASGVAAAAYLTSFEEDTKTILANIDKIISTASDMNIEMHGIFSKISDAVKERVDKISNKVKSDEIGYLANLHKLFEEDVNAFISKYRKALTTTDSVTDIFPFKELNKLDSILSADCPLDENSPFNEYGTLKDDKIFNKDGTFKDNIFNEDGTFNEEFFNEDGTLKDSVFNEDERYKCLLGKSILETIKNSYGGYFGVFESYDSRIKKIRANIIGLKRKISNTQIKFK